MLGTKNPLVMSYGAEFSVEYLSVGLVLNLCTDVRSEVSQMGTVRPAGLGASADLLPALGVYHL